MSVLCISCFFSILCVSANTLVVGCFALCVSSLIDVAQALCSLSYDRKINYGRCIVSMFKLLGHG